MNTSIGDARNFWNHFEPSSADWGRDIPFLLKLREKARDFLACARTPSIKQEDWRYTDLSLLSELPLVSSLDGNIDHAVLQKSILLSEGLPVIIHNGRLLANTLPPELPRGVRILSASQAEPDICEDAFGLSTSNDAQLFLRLSDLYCPDLIHIAIAGDVALDQIINVVMVQDQGTANKAVMPRLVITLEAGARARIMGSALTLHKEPLLFNAITDVRIASGAELEMIQAFKSSTVAHMFQSTRVVQKKDSTFRSFVFTDGAELFRNNLSILLEGEGASASLNGLHRLKGGQHADSHTFVEHKAPNTNSNQLYKTILEDESRSIFNGRIRVLRDAQLTNSYQLNKNLLLSPDARVDTKPQLEIFAYDVKCSHGATIGQLDDEQLFYLASRGISHDQSVQMLIRGFIDDVLSQVSDAELRNKLFQIVG